MLTTLVSFLAVLIGLVLVHEFGHFVVAKLSRIRVEEFGIFLPPRLLSFRRGETIYSLNAVPLGGFVRMAGEEDPAVPRSLAGKSIPVRLLALGAGSLMNLLLPFLLFSLALMIPQEIPVGDVVVEEIAPDSPAQAAGIQPGDYITGVNGEKVRNVGDYSYAVNLNLGKEITVSLRQADGGRREVTLTPRVKYPEGQGATGVAVRTVNIQVVSSSETFWRAVPHGAVKYWEMLILVRNGIIATVRGALPFEVAGPVGIAQLTGEVAKTGMANLLELAAIISFNLGLVNIFPLPALDGGRIIFVLLEWVRRGKRVSPKTERMVHTVGFALLMTLILLVTYWDILRIISGGTILP